MLAWIRPPYKDCGGGHLATAEAHAAYQDAEERADLEQELARQGFISKRQSDRSHNFAERKLALYRIQVDRVTNRHKVNEIEQRRLQAEIDHHRDNLHDRLRDQQALTVLAKTGGILQQLGPSPNVSIEVGQRISTGGIVAKITNPGRLKAVLRISETQARDIVIGQQATIDTRSAIIAGRVIRIDPAVQEGTVAVDVELDGQLPKGARPDLTVDGTIEIERLENVVYMDRPVYGQSDSVLGIFKLQPDGMTAVRAAVQLGRSSVTTIEVLDGLHEGDRVILSDMSRWEDVDRITIR